MNEALATWIPAPLLVAAVVAMGMWIWKNLSKRLDKIETAISELHKFATIEQLGSIGDRFDERIGNLRERVSVLEAIKND